MSSFFVMNQKQSCGLAEENLSRLKLLKTCYLFVQESAELKLCKQEITEMQFMYRECVHICSCLTWFTSSRLSKRIDKWEEKEVIWAFCPSVSSVCTYYMFAWKLVEFAVFLWRPKPMPSGKFLKVGSIFSLQSTLACLV